MLSPARAQALKPQLDRFVAEYDAARRVEVDPIHFPHRYRRREDIEVSALIACCLAYGRVDLFTPKLEALFAGMGQSPADYVAAFDPARHRKLLEGFVYRFNLAGDLGLLLSGIGALLRQHGSLEAAFPRGRPLQQALSGFVGQIRSHPQERVLEALGPIRGLEHLLPEPLRGGSCKRLLLFLRWMVRGPDRVDFGLWRLPASELVIPLDTHIGRLSRHLGLTARRDLSWRTAEEITASLRLLDPADPVKYDFALCHHGMSGACPARLTTAHCAACALRPACPTGSRRGGRRLETRAPAG